MKKHMSKSLRKFIRREKARIRREVLDLKEQDSLIEKLYEGSAVAKAKAGKENDN